MHFIIIVSITVPASHCTDSWELHWLQVECSCMLHTETQTKSFFLYLSKSLSNYHSSAELGVMTVKHVVPKSHIWQSIFSLLEENYTRIYHFQKYIINALLINLNLIIRLLLLLVLNFQTWSTLEMKLKLPQKFFPDLNNYNAQSFSCMT